MRRRLGSAWSALIHRRRVERDLADQIALHLELETEKNIAAGMSPRQARRKARLAFGSVDAVTEAHREGRGTRWLEELVTDIRYAGRTLRRNPVLGGAAIITLAVGIGANTAIYSAVNAVIVRPLPVSDPARLVMLWEQNPEKGWYQNVDAPANVLDWQAQVSAFQDVGAYMPYVNSLTMTGDGDPVVLTGYTVTGNLFSVLGVHPALGRTFTDAETWASGVRGAVLSDRLWRNQFGADPDVIGRTIELNARPYQVVGVLPAAFTFPGLAADVFTTTNWDPAQRSAVSFRRAHYLRAVARLKRGVSLRDADAQFQVVVGRLEHDYPATNQYMGAGMTPLQPFLTGSIRPALLVLLGAVALLLLIACANVGNLLLMHAAGRSREAALRLALGAGRRRLLRQAITESLLISFCGGLVGMALGVAGTSALELLQPAGLLPVEHFRISWDVVGYVVAITTASGLLFSVAPGWWAMQRAPGEVLKDGGARGGTGVGVRWGAGMLVVAEVALALLLTIGAGLLVRSFSDLLDVAPGFDPHGVLAVSLNIPGARYSDATRISGFFEQFRSAVQRLPGVQSAALTTTLPLSGGVGYTSDFMAAGRPADGYGTNVAHRSVSPGYFRTMRVPIIAGRDFTQADVLDGDQVIIINQALAQSYFRGEDPIGQRIAFDKVPDSNSVWRTVVGVVGDERQTDLATTPQIEALSPQQQAPSTFMSLVVRTGGDPQSFTPAIRRTLHDLDPTIAITSVVTMDQVRRDSVARQRFLLTLVAGFALAGLLLATVGVYAVMAHAAQLRTRELGIRLALGAGPGRVEWLLVRDGLRLAAVGIGAGLAVSLVACRFLSSVLYGVAPRDPLTFVIVPVLLAVTAVAASWFPALRAGRVDPMETLRID